MTKSLRFTAEEWVSVENKLAGRDFSAVARALLLGSEIPEPKKTVRREIIRKRMTEAEAAVSRQLAWIGNNLNQIARATHLSMGGPRVAVALFALRRAVEQLARNAK